jgi:hypothetical protein
LAIGQAVINTAVSVTASSKVGYPEAIPFVAAAIAEGAVQVAAIASQKFASGGIVEGNRYPADSVQASLTGGEMVLNEKQQANLFSLANGTGSAGGSMQVDMSISISGNADSNTVTRIEETREAQLRRFKSMYAELVHRRQL